MAGLAACWKRYARRDDLRGRVIAAYEDWLTAVEREELARLRDAERREGWLLARIVSKELILEQLPSLVADPRRIEVTSRGADGRGVRPRVAIGGQRQPWSLSISHSRQAVLVALSVVPGCSVGVDLVDLGEYDTGFLEMMFTPDEQDWLRPASPEQVAAAWAVKEAVYKAYNREEGFAPRRICVRRLDAERYTCTYFGVDLTAICDIETWRATNQVAAVVCVDARQPAGEHTV
jgi:phosphopantetheinyl transferase